jgi:hypothetical protein
MDVFDVFRFLLTALAWKGDRWTAQEWDAAAADDEIARRRRG